MKTRLVIVACALLLAPLPIFAGLIVGIENSGSPFHPTTFSTVDPNTGSTSPFGQFFSSGYIAISPSPVAGTFFASSPVNVYRINPFTGEFIGYLCLDQQDCEFARSEIAYDPSNQNIYSLGVIGTTPALVQMVDRGLLPPNLGPPGSHRVTFVPIGNLGVNDIRIIEFIPGLGLYGTDGVSAGYLINESTGQASLLSPLSGVGAPGITGLAYDYDTGQLFASSGFLFGLPFGNIYQLDPLSGQTRLLNSKSADLVGIAFVSIPEAQPVWMLAAGLLLCVVLRKRLNLCQIRVRRGGLPPG